MSHKTLRWNSSFWWIAGDCLGFRRATAISPSTNKTYAFAADLRYDNSFILSYEEQLQVFTSKGFCLWDVVQSCQRSGSLDQDIKREVPNDLRGFVLKHPSIRRIVLANGGSGSKFFVKHFRDWLQSGELVPGNDADSQTAFGKACRLDGLEDVMESRVDSRRSLISALAVSPAAARWTYQQKRDFWDEHVYKPGLQDLNNCDSSI
jgi:hypoxanthine-DNA glycosylase